MGKELRYVTFHTAMGWVGILALEKGLVATTLPQPSEGEAARQLGNGVEYAVRSPQSLSDLAERFKSYFSGEKIEFPDELDLSEATPFQKQVWQAARLIPYGETRSYLWIAEKIGKPREARAVGQALGKNPLPIIIPCHRVIANDGGLGGFSGGLKMKRRLLKMEGSSVIPASHPVILRSEATKNLT